LIVFHVEIVKGDGPDLVREKEVRQHLLLQEEITMAETVV
jgi:hypothetical protein